MRLKTKYTRNFLLLGAMLLTIAPQLLLAQFNTLSTGSRDFKGSRLQGNGGIFVPQWTDTLAIQSQQDTSTIFLAPIFEDAHLDEKVRNLPFYTVKIPLAANQEIMNVSSVGQNAREEDSPLYRGTVKEAKLSAVGDWYPAAHVIKGERVIERTKHYQLVHIYPRRVDASGRRVQIADRIDYTFTKRTVAQKGGATVLKNSSGFFFLVGRHSWRRDFTVHGAL